MECSVLRHQRLGYRGYLLSLRCCERGEKRRHCSCASHTAEFRGFMEHPARPPCRPQRFQRHKQGTQGFRFFEILLLRCLQNALAQLRLKTS